MENFGKILSDSRKKLNLSIDQVCERLKIRPHVIEALENEDFTIMTKVYLMAFIKSYCKFLKLDLAQFGEYLNSKFAELQPTIQTKTLEDNQVHHKVKSGKKQVYIFPNFSFPNFNIYKANFLQNPQKKTIITYIIYSGIGLGLLAIVFLLVIPVDSGTSYTKKIVGTDSSLVEMQTKKVVAYFEGPTDSLSLDVHATDTSWMRIETDGKKNEQLRLMPGADRKYFAKEYFILTVGNAGALEFKRNGQLLEKFGPKGTVVNNVKITKSEIINSANPWKMDSLRAYRKKKVKQEEVKPQPPVRIIELKEFKPKPYIPEKKR
ncbi:MAG: DUF4115 domain-containing protein [Candidatus Kapabacteria bacterium]|nr:DUF4115 domain-containing protein [Candidatus Kapabacteria bacterium]